MDASRPRPCNAKHCATDNDSDREKSNAPSTAVHTPEPPDGPDFELQQSEADDPHRNKNKRWPQLPKEQRGWRKVIRNFTPSWFAVTMGTGIVSILLHNFTYNAPWLYWISVVIFVLNIFLFTTFLALSTLRYTMYPEIWSVMIRHPAQSLFLGTFPMGLATIINMIVFVCVPVWGGPAVYIAWTLWWLDAIVSVATCCYLPFVIMYLHKTELLAMTAAWLLPIVAPIVAAASGGIVAEVLPNPQHALLTVVTSYILWGTGVPLAMAVLVIYFQRLTIHKLPPREVIVSVFLPLGPLGQGGFGIMQLVIGNSGDILYVVGWLLALIMWGFGLVWLFFALASISRSKFPFNMGWWGFTFPLGVFTVSTTAIGEEMPSKFFEVLGAIFSIIVTLLWIMVSIGTVRGAVSGRLLIAPCLKDLDEKEKLREKLGVNSFREHPLI